MPEGLPTERPLASAEGLVKAYPGGIRALDGADLRVEAREIVGLIGANGSGKTTLLGALSGQVRPDGGRVSVAGFDPQSLEARSRTGFASQEQSLDPDMTGRETAAFFACLLGLPRGGMPRLADLLDAFGLEDRADGRVSGYSGGMRQRLHLLLAFLHDPDLVLLDEPANGLDPEGRETFWKFLRGRTDRGAGALLSLHDLAESAARCTRVAIMAEGRIRAVGTPADLTAKLGAWLWKAELAARPGEPLALRTRLEALPGVRQLDLEAESVSLWMGDARAGDGAILDILASAQCEVKAYHRQRPDLASVYRLAAGRAWEDAPGKDGGSAWGGGRAGRGGRNGGGGRGNGVDRPGNRSGGGRRDG